MNEIPFWDALSADYDRFVDWDGRLAREIPVLDELLAHHPARRVLDVACGTGHHAIALAKRGYEVLGSDGSERMIAKARQNAKAEGVLTTFLRAGFGELRQTVSERYDAALCLGNSLPSLLNEKALRNALEDMGAVLVSGGLLIAQTLNYDRLWHQRERFMPLQTHRHEDEEWLFVRFMDFHQETLTFNMLVLHKNDQRWSCRSGSTELRPIFSDDLKRLLEQSGFAKVDFYGDYDLNPYEQDTSGDLIVVAQREA
jgi:SAM-dependent methyltransferase